MTRPSERELSVAACSECGSPLRAQSKICLSCGHFQGSRRGSSADDQPTPRAQHYDYRISDMLWSPAEATTTVIKLTPWWLIVLLMIAQNASPLLLVWAIPPQFLEGYLHLQSGSVAVDFLRTLGVNVAHGAVICVATWLTVRCLQSRASVGEITKVIVLAGIPLLFLLGAAGLAIFLRHPVCGSFLTKLGASGILIYYVAIVPVTVWAIYIWYVGIRAASGLSHPRTILTVIVSLVLTVASHLFIDIQGYRGFGLKEENFLEDYVDTLPSKRRPEWRSIEGPRPLPDTARTA